MIKNNPKRIKYNIKNISCTSNDYSFWFKFVPKCNVSNINEDANN